MDTITKNGVVQEEYKYNALGQQVVRQLNGQGITINAVYDLNGNRIAEYNAQTSTLLAEYVWLNGQPVAAISGGVTYFVRADHIGRPAFATDGTGAVVWDATYKPFGEVDSSTGAPINLRFPGQWFSAESDLNQNWMRDYDPTTGRYIQTDPLGLVDGASVYGYALQSPNRYSDFRGECAGVCVGAGALAVWGYRAYRVYKAVQTLGSIGGQAGAGAGTATANSADNAGEEGKEAAEEAAAENGQCPLPDPDDDDDENKGLNQNPFGDKTAEEIDEMFEKKGFIKSGKDPKNGQGGYTNPKTGRSHHIDPKEYGKYGEPNHVDVNRPRGYKGPLSKKKFSFKD